MEVAMTLQTAPPAPAAPQPAAPAGERRNGPGRDRPYQTLRTLAKLYNALAPFVLAVMVVIGFGSFTGEAPPSSQLGSFAGMVIVGLIYFLIMKSLAQAIYLLFDISGGIARLTEFTANLEARQASASGPTASQA
jgi:hypothetical protein